MNNNIAQHFRKAELPFLESMDDLVHRSINEYRPILTNFLNPRQRYLLQIIVNSYDDTELSCYGGLHNSEMQRAMIAPNYFEPRHADFQLGLFEINYPVKFASLHHHQILGTLMGAGIDRNVIGDILFNGVRWQFVAEQSLTDYLKLQIDRIGRIKVNLKTESIEQIIQPLSEWQPVVITATSLRVDNIIAHGFNISRNIAKELVTRGKIHLNWGQFDRPDYELAPNDILSVRGYGRLMLLNVLGTTRRNKLKISLSILKK